MEPILTEGIRAARRVAVGVIGMTVLAVGLALLVLPGPAFIVIPIGLGILAVEFEWARRWLRRAREVYSATAPKTGQAQKHDAGPTRETQSGPDEPSSTA